MTACELIGLLESPDDLSKLEREYLAKWIRERLSSDAQKDHLDAARRVLQRIPKINIHSSGYLEEADKWIDEKKKEDEVLPQNRPSGFYLVKISGESIKKVYFWNYFTRQWNDQGHIISDLHFTSVSKRSVLEMLGEL